MQCVSRYTNLGPYFILPCMIPWKPLWHPVALGFLCKEWVTCAARLGPISLTSYLIPSGEKVLSNVVLERRVDFHSLLAGDSGERNKGRGQRNRPELADSDGHWWLESISTKLSNFSIHSILLAAFKKPKKFKEVIRLFGIESLSLLHNPLWEAV